MRKQHLAGKFAISTVSLVGLLLSNSIFSADLSGNGRRGAKIDGIVTLLSTLAKELTAQSRK